MPDTLRPAPAGTSALLTPPERRWRAALLLGWPLALGAAPVLTTLSDIQLCAFRQLTGKPCPLCGGTHACAALVEGDPAAAWQANPGVVVLLGVAAAHSLQLAKEAVTGRTGLFVPAAPWRLNVRSFWSIAVLALLANWLQHLI